MQKPQKIFLCILLSCSIATSNITLSYNWGLKIKKAILFGIIQVTIAGLASVLVQWLNSEYAEKRKIQHEIEINKILKENLQHIKIHSRDRKLIKKAREAYIKSCIQIIKLREEYFKKHAQKA